MHNACECSGRFFAPPGINLYIMNFNDCLHLLQTLANKLYIQLMKVYQMSGFITQSYQFMSFSEIQNLSHFSLCNQYHIPKFKCFGNWEPLLVDVYFRVFLLFQAFIGSIKFPRSRLLQVLTNDPRLCMCYLGSWMTLNCYKFEFSRNFA